MITRHATRKVMRTAIIVSAVGVIFGYTYFASRDYMNGPSLEIFSPDNGSTIYEPTANLEGRAQRIQEITLNGRAILVDEAGNFHETLLLLPGYNVALLEARDKFGRNIEYKIELVYQDEHRSIEYNTTSTPDYQLTD